jgi:hypothetical protein
MSKSHTLKLTHGSAELLRVLLMAPNWYANAADAHRAGTVLEHPAMDNLEPPKDEKAAEEWRKVPREVEMTEKERDTAKKCVEHFISKGAFRLDRWAIQLIRELGLAPTD